MSTSPFHGIFSALNEEEGSEKEELPVGFTEPPAQQSGQQPGRVAVDIYEQDGYYIIKAPIAGIRMSDLDIEVNDSTITIRGHRKQMDPVADDQYYLRECFWGEFSRSVTLPITIDPKKVRATFTKESCILKILIPKEERVKIVRINEG
jgi:HSP20 family protein